MTLPTEITLPLLSDFGSASDIETQKTFFRNLNLSLTDMYRDIVQNVNGTIKQWTPIAYGLSTEGTGTYTHQTGWVRRSGIITEVWFDIGWNAHTGTGGLAILMPYKAAKSSNEPWVGVIQSVSASNDFGVGYTYLVWKVEQDTTQGTIVRCGSTVATDSQQIANVGAYAGYIQYIGQENG